MGAQVRPGLRQPDPAASAYGRRQMAPRRGCSEDRRQETLALARGGPDRDGARRAGPEPAGQTGRQTLAAKTTEKAGFIYLTQHIPYIWCIGELKRYGLQNVAFAASST